MLMTFSFSHRDCKWLPDNIKEEYLERVKEVEMSVLRAVISLSDSYIFLGISLMGTFCGYKLTYQVICYYLIFSVFR